MTMARNQEAEKIPKIQSTAYASTCWDKMHALGPYHTVFSSCVWVTHTYNKRANYAL